MHAVPQQARIDDVVLHASRSTAAKKGQGPERKDRRVECGDENGDECQDERSHQRNEFQNPRQDAEQHGVGNPEDGETDAGETADHDAGE